MLSEWKIMLYNLRLLCQGNDAQQNLQGANVLIKKKHSLRECLLY